MSSTGCKAGATGQLSLFLCKLLQALLMLAKWPFAVHPAAHLTLQREQCCLYACPGLLGRLLLVLLMKGQH